MRYAPIAQLDRVTDYESVGRGFESLSAYQKIRGRLKPSPYFLPPRDSKGRHQWAHWCKNVPVARF